MENTDGSLNIKFYVCEAHTYAGTFSFIAQLVNADISDVKGAFVFERVSPLINFWVECRTETNKTTLAGSGFVPEQLSINMLKLSVELKNGTSAIFSFPPPSYVEQGTLSYSSVGKEQYIKYWSSHGLTGVNYSCLNQSKALYPDSNVFIHESTIENNSLTTVPLIPKTQPYQPIPTLPSTTDKHPHLDKILALKNIHQGRDAVLIGNGPSLELSQLKNFDDHVFFSFNRFYLGYDDTKFRPNYLISADQQMIDDFGTEMINKADANVFLASQENPKLAGDYIWLRSINIFPSLFSENISDYVTPGGATPYVAMQIAAYMGIKNIYLLGFDYKYKFFVENHRLEDNLVEGDGNHFVKGYREGKPWVPPSFRNIGHSFWMARLYFEQMGGKIVNLTPNSSLGIF